mmetsp:Transcript_3693/g.4972  ORF Transcript_3693/g.4972 Transcript_3693/m.4972 type:complete len:304 (-) Transcript_3693:2114-3025(-)
MLGDELHGLEHRKLELGRLDFLLQGLKARGRVAHHWVLTILGCLEQRLLQLLHGDRGGLGETLGVEHHPAALRGHAIGVHNLVPTLVEDGEEFLVRGGGLSVKTGGAHGAGDAGGHVHDLERLRARSSCWLQRLFECRGSLGQVPVPGGDSAATGYIEFVGGPFQECRAQESVEDIHGVKQARDHGVEQGHVVGQLHGHGGGALLGVLHLVGTNALDHFSSVDLDGTLFLAHSVSGAGGLPVVAEERVELAQPLLILRGLGGQFLHALDLPPYRDSLSGCERQVLCRAVALAETALNAPVYEG